RGAEPVDTLDAIDQREDRHNAERREDAQHDSAVPQNAAQADAEAEEDDHVRGIVRTKVETVPDGGTLSGLSRELTVGAVEEEGDEEKGGSDLEASMVLGPEQDGGSDRG